MPAAEANPPRPWSLDTPLRVFSLVLELGDAPRREWLLYAHSPAEKRVVTTVRLPGGPALRIVATPGGCFSFAQESTRRVERSLCA
jgi:hypothetical protein